MDGVDGKFPTVWEVGVGLDWALSGKTVWQVHWRMNWTDDSQGVIPWSSSSIVGNLWELQNQNFRIRNSGGGPQHCFNKPSNMPNRPGWMALRLGWCERWSLDHEQGLFWVKNSQKKLFSVFFWPSRSPLPPNYFGCNQYMSHVVRQRKFAHSSRHPSKCDFLKQNRRQGYYSCKHDLSCL